MKGIGFALLVAVMVATVLADQSIVNTPYGPVQGVVTETARSFKVYDSSIQVTLVSKFHMGRTHVGRKNRWRCKIALSRTPRQTSPWKLALTYRNIDFD
jgi:hypothetical protein